MPRRIGCGGRGVGCAGWERGGVGGIGWVRREVSLQAKKRPGPDSECHAGRRQLLFAVGLFALLGF